MPRRGAKEGFCLEAAGEGLGAQLAEALLAAKLEDLQRQGVKALPLSVSSCCLQLFPELPAAFAVVNIATCYNFSNLSSVELDVANAQQFLEQLGPGKRPLWAVPVLLRPKTAGLVMVFTAAFRESGSVRAHLAKACPLTELKHWSLSNSRNEQVTFLNVDAECCAVPGDPSGEARRRLAAAAPGPAPGPAAPGERRAAEAAAELLKAEAKEAARRAKKSKPKRSPVKEVMEPECVEVETAESDGEMQDEVPAEADLTAAPGHATLDGNCDVPTPSGRRATVHQLLTGWMASLRAEESCRDRAQAVNLWHYRRNENACWRLSFLRRAVVGKEGFSVCEACGFGRQAVLCSCAPDPWQPLPEIEPDGSDPQLLLAPSEPPGLEPALTDCALWRHLLRGTHGFSLHGPQTVSLYPDAPEAARSARRRQRNAGWRRWWLTWQKARARVNFAPAPILAPTTVFMPVPVHLAFKVQQYIEQLLREEHASPIPGT